jgi:hypothetical protein
MNMNPRLLAAAVTGLLLGAGCSTSAKPDSVIPGPTTAGAEDHPCSAANDCKGEGENAQADHSCKGLNECKGQGGCHSDNHSCKGLNDCKGQGGCKGT